MALYYQTIKKLSCSRPKCNIQNVGKRVLLSSDNFVFFKTLKKLQNFKKQQKFQIAKSPTKNGFEKQTNQIKKPNLKKSDISVVQKVRSDYFFLVQEVRCKNKA